MGSLRFTLVSDGSSDDVLLHVLRWVLIEANVALPLDPRWADLRRLRQPPPDLSSRIQRSVELYPCDLLFVHRDAEGQNPVLRREEIEAALEAAAIPDVPAVCVTPVRMTEAWLLFDDALIREAAGNPRGEERLNLPPIRRLEELPDPKAVLREVLCTASGRRGRRLQKFEVAKAARRLAELITDFSRLRGVSAFDRLENDLTLIVERRGWNRS